MEDKLSLMIISGLFGGLFLFLSSFGGWYGCRGEEKIYSFNYKNQEAAIIRKDMRFAKDQYYIAIGNDKLVGKLVSDDGKEITIGDKWGHAVRNGQYSIRDQEIMTYK